LLTGTVPHAEGAVPSVGTNLIYLANHGRCQGVRYSAGEDTTDSKGTALYPFNRSAIQAKCGDDLVETVFVHRSRLS